MKEKFAAFINDLIVYDYILFGSTFLLFILFITLTILLRNKVVMSIFMFILSFTILLLAPTLGYVKMHEFLFKNSVKITSQKKLTFTQAVVVKGVLSNESKVEFKSCKITASAYKVTGNVVKDFIFPFNPFMNMSIIEDNIYIGEQREFKIIIEPFTYTKDYNISIGAKCK